MKICPTCNKTYTDETLNFCLSDGSVLNPFVQDSMSEPTIFMGQTPLTIQNPTIVQPQDTNQAFQQTKPTVYQPNTLGGPTQNYSPPAKKSKAWLWVLGIFGVLVVIGGIGFIGLIGLVVSNIEDDPKGNNNPPKNTPEVAFDSILKDDFSKWQVDSNSFGTTELSNGEFIMSSKQTGFFYVLVTAASNFKTSNASTKIIARNVTGKETRLGYGLLIHSDPNKALVKDYAFLIDSSKQSYRIVRHLSSKETEQVGWTRFPAIRSGTQTNEIEIRDQKGKMSYFINGQFATSITDSSNFTDGVVGLYVSDAVPVAFSNLQVSK